MQAKKVAEHLNRKPDAVYKSLQRIYQKLRECISSKNLATGIKIITEDGFVKLVLRNHDDDLSD